MEQENKKQKKIILWLLFIIGILGVVCFYIYYLKTENHIKIWDMSCYWRTIINEKIFLMEKGLKETFVWLQNSIKFDDYNIFPTTILMPFFYFSNNSFFGYIMSVVILFLLPFFGICTLLYQKYYKNENPSIWKYILYFISILLCVQLHKPIMYGYLDVIGLMLIAFIFYLTYDYNYETFHWKKTVCLSLSCFFLILSRRYYLNWVVGYFAALFIYYSVIDLIRKRNFKLWITRMFHIAIVGLGFTIPIFVFYSDLIMRIIQNDYAFMYKAYAAGGMIAGLKRFVEYFGLIPLLIATLGFALSLRKKEKRPFSILLLLTGCFSYLIFTRIQNMGEQHYYILLMGILFFIAIAPIELYDLLTKTKKRNYVAPVIFTISVLLYGINFVFLFQGEGVRETILFTSGRNPIYSPVAKNIEEPLAFIHDKLAGTNDQIYIISSSHNYNSETFKNYNLPSYEYQENIADVSNVDLRDGFPVSFFHSKYVMTVTPVQYHLEPEDQQVIGILYQAMETDTPLNDNYEICYEKEIGEVTFKIYEKVNAIEQDDKEYFIKQFNQSYQAHPELFETRIREYVEE